MIATSNKINHLNRLNYKSIDFFNDDKKKQKKGIGSSRLHD